MSGLRFERSSAADSRFAKIGAERFVGALTDRELDLLESLCDAQIQNSPGVRIRDTRDLKKILGEGGTFDKISKIGLGERARPVRVVLFNKTASSNWSLGWHQDRTIAVCEKRETEGYGPWSLKSGIHHVEPPFDLLSRMVTIRAHLDACDEDNAPLLIIPGSHRLGRIPLTNMEQVANDFGSSVCLADAGDVWLYATPIVHSSKVASKPARRRVLQIDYSRDELPGGLDWYHVLGAGSHV
jgi:hypothetical protein